MAYAASDFKQRVLRRARWAGNAMSPFGPVPTRRTSIPPRLYSDRKTVAFPHDMESVNLTSAQVYIFDSTDTSAQRGGILQIIKITIEPYYIREI